jgi:hypothetical protein
MELVGNWFMLFATTCGRLRWINLRTCDEIKATIIAEKIYKSKEKLKISRDYVLKRSK